MIKKICVCDKCGKEVSDKLIVFNIVYKTKDADYNLGEDEKTEYKEFCRSCFNNMLDDLEMKKV